MGEVLGKSSDAHCFACGYDKFLMLGAGMRNDTTHAAWPVSCEVCSEITTANYKQTPLVCDRCGTTNVLFINDPEVWKGDGESRGNVGRFETHGRNYQCPRCEDFALRFGTNAGGHGRIHFD